MAKNTLPAVYDWPARDQFRNRVDELAAMERWAEHPQRHLLLYGRRRVGKSWLFRQFAHGRHAEIMVVGNATPEVQFAGFAAQLEPWLGVAPEIASAADLVRACYRAARELPLLVVIDEFQYLLPRTETARMRVLTQIQAVIEEERDASQLRLVICGSAVRTLELLLDERNPLHGRLQGMMVRPLDFWHARPMLDDLPDARTRIERYAICGGMPMYLAQLGRDAAAVDAVVPYVLDRFGGLHNEVPTVLAQELTEPRTYFSLLQELAYKPRTMSEIADALKVKTTDLPGTIETLQSMQLVSKRQPVGADPKDRNAQYVLDDEFVRFWFRFVFPFQRDIEAGLDPRGLYNSQIAGNLADHTSQVYEEICRGWARHWLAERAQRLGAWWGKTAPAVLKQHADRGSEEIDIVGLKGNTRTVSVLGECKWTNKQMDRGPLFDLREYKIPSLLHAGYKLDKEHRILLFSRSGFAPALVEEAEADPSVTLVGLDEVDTVPAAG